MPNYDVVVVDKIAPTIPSKLKEISTKATEASLAIKQLREDLKLPAARGSSGKAIATEAAAAQVKLKQASVQLAIAQNRLQVSLNNSAFSTQKMTAAGMHDLAVENKRIASSIRHASVINVKASATTNLTKKEIQAAIAANRLQISNNQLKLSYIQISAAEERLVQLRKRGEFAINAEARAVDRLAIAQQRAARSATRNITTNTRLQKSYHTLGQSILGTLRSIRIFAGTTIIFSAARGLVGAVDTYQLVENRIKAVTRSSTELNAVTREAYERSNEARISVTAFTEAYQRYANVLVRTGKSQKEVLDFTSTITKSLKIFGATVAETESVLRQLAQALTKGNLDGQELKALRENAPIQVLQSMADVMGVNVGEMKKLGAQGKITNDIIFAGIQRLKVSVDATFLTQVKTIGEAFVVIGNKAAEFFEQSKSAEKMANALFLIGDNLAFILKAVIAIAIYKSIITATTVSSTLFTLTLGAQARAFDAMGIAARRATVATAAFGKAAKLAFFALKRIPVIAIAAAGAALYTYREEIKVTEDESVSFGTVLRYHWEETGNLLGEIFSHINVDLGNIFTSKDAGSLIQNISKFAVSAIKSLAGIGVHGAAFVTKFFTLAFQDLKLIVLNLVKFLTEKLQSPLTKLQRNLNLTVAGFNAKFTTNIPQLDVVPGKNAIASLDKAIDETEAKIAMIPGNIEVATAISLGKVSEFVDSVAEVYEDTLRERAQDELDIEKHKNDQLKKGQEELLKTTKGNMDARTGYNKAQLDKMLADYQAYSKNIARLQQLPVGIGAVADQYNNANESSNRFFNSASKGYTTMLDQSAKFTQAATVGFQEAGKAFVGAFGGGDEKGKFIKGIIASLLKAFIAAKQARFGEILAQGANRPASRGGSELGDRGLASLQAEADFATQGIDNAEQALQRLYQTLITTTQQGKQNFNDFFPAAAIVRVRNTENAVKGLATTVAGVEQSVTALGSTFGSSLAQPVATATNQAKTNINSVGSSASNTGNRVGSAFKQGSKTATAAIGSFSKSAIEDLNEIKAAAEAAAAAVARAASGPSRARLFGPGGGPGFSHGGYTGNTDVNKVAGVVHGREFVMPAQQTKKYRSLLESMRSGSAPVVHSSGKSSTNVTIKNYGNSEVTARQMSDGELLIVIEEKSRAAAQREGPKAVAAAISNPNSKVSKSLNRNTTSQRRR